MAQIYHFEFEKIFSSQGNEMLWLLSKMDWFLSNFFGNYQLYLMAIYILNIKKNKY